MKHKRILTLVLMLCLVLTIFPAMASASSGTLPFQDVQKTDWFFDPVEFVYGYDMMTGTSHSTFSPQGTTTRCMLVSILHRMENSPEAKSASFKDVPDDAYYAMAVNWASENKIVHGYSKNVFAPNYPITRQQLATILYKYAKFKNYDTSASTDLTRYTDAGSISAYARDAMKWAVAEKLINGVNDQLLDPNGHATRAQAASILSQFCTKIAGIAPPIPVKPDNPSDADNYYWNNSEVLDVKSAKFSPELTNETETKNLLDGRGFDGFPIYCNYSIDGAFLDLREIPANTTAKYPMYQTYYVSQANELWTIYVIDGKVYADPISFNMESTLGAELLVSESEVLTSYDDVGNQYYVNIPKGSAAIVKTVDRIDAATLDCLTVEVLGR